MDIREIISNVWQSEILNVDGINIHRADIGVYGTDIDEIQKNDDVKYKMSTENSPMKYNAKECNH